MLVYLPVDFPDSCSGCDRPFGPAEEHLGVLYGPQEPPSGPVASLAALVDPRALCARCGPPPGTPARVLGRPEGREGRGRPALYGPEHFVLVAEVYRGALPGGSPTRAVAEAFRVGRSAANKWVAEARRRGHLPPTRRGVASG